MIKLNFPRQRALLDTSRFLHFWLYLVPPGGNCPLQLKSKQGSGSWGAGQLRLPVPRQGFQETLLVFIHCVNPIQKYWTRRKRESLGPYLVPLLIKSQVTDSEQKVRFIRQSYHSLDVKSLIYLNLFCISLFMNEEIDHKTLGAECQVHISVLAFTRFAIF